ncbi:hypothetical protein [Pedobacter miscanthi]|uniref:hypothetical protein n=1 Tax=Pedobacter miscanthi TaxID=2259170 RepID=UPI00292E59A5|nr:hypothetical protein [Pedobacter miscanthi]
MVSKNYEFFQFIWFVTCLSHDAAFYSEHDSDLIDANPDISSLKRHLNIEYDLTFRKVADVPEDMFRLSSAYYKFRHGHLSHHCVDHGIYAGLLMYDRLVKNRLAKKAANDNTLLWEEYLDDHYAYAAATVAVHNIWLPKKQDYQMYSDAGLSELIGRAPIKFTEAPLLFLLGLVDTIDPIKAYPNLTPKEVLKNIYLTFPAPMCFTIRVSKKLDFETLYIKSGYLNDWLLLKVDVSGRSITISIKGH